MSPASSVNDHERRLAQLVVDFVNQPAPQTADEVLKAEAKLARHPFADPAGFYGLGSGDHTPEQLAIAIRSTLEDLRRDHEEMRQVLVALARDAAALRASVGEWLVGRFREVFEPSQTDRLDARVTFAFRRGLGLRVQPLLATPEQARWWGLALLVDSRRDLARGFTQCQAPAGPPVAKERRPRRSEVGLGGPRRECGKFFWRTEERQRYCSEGCAQRVSRAKTVRRVQRSRILALFRELLTEYGRAEAERRLRAQFPRHLDLVESIIEEHPRKKLPRTSG